MKHKPYEGEVLFKPAPDKSGVFVVIKTTRWKGKRVNKNEKKGFIPKPVGVPFDAWVADLSVELEGVLR